MAAAFQTAVSFKQGFGVQGDIYDSFPVKVQSFILNSVSAANNIIGATGFSYVSDGVAGCGNPSAKPFVGVLVNSKDYASYGTQANGTLAPTLVLPNNTQAQLITIGSCVVKLPATANVGDLVIMDNTTGALATIAPSATLPVGKSPVFAFVDYYSITGAGLAVITFSQTLIYLPAP